MKGSFRHSLEPISLQESSYEEAALTVSAQKHPILARVDHTVVHSHEARYKGLAKVYVAPQIIAQSSGIGASSLNFLLVLTQSELHSSWHIMGFLFRQTHLVLGQNVQKLCLLTIGQCVSARGGQVSPPRTCSAIMLQDSIAIQTLCLECSRLDNKQKPRF